MSKSAYQPKRLMALAKFLRTVPKKHFNVKHKVDLFWSSDDY